MNSQEDNYEIEAEDTTVASESKRESEEWEDISESASSQGTKVLKYFPGHGYFEGVVTKVEQNIKTKEVIYHIHYPEDGDNDVLDQIGYDTAKKYAGMEPRPVLPPQLLDRDQFAISASSISSIHEQKEVGASREGTSTNEDASPVSIQPDATPFDFTAMEVGSKVKMMYAVQDGETRVTCTRIMNSDGQRGINISSQLNEVGHDVYDNTPDGLHVQNATMFRLIVSPVVEDPRHKSKSPTTTETSAEDNVLAIYSGNGGG